MKHLRSFLSLLAFHREVWAWPLGIVLLCLAAIHFVVHLTGRAVIDDPGAIVGWLFNAIKIVLALVLTGQAQQHLFGYRSNGENPSLSDDLHDSTVCFALLSLFLFVLSH